MFKRFSTNYMAMLFLLDGLLIQLSLWLAMQLRFVVPLGQEVRALASGSLAAGDHTVSWDGRTNRGGEAGSGGYFFRVTGGGETAATRLVLAR